ncbi:gustatory receptor for sugar taste 64e-like isoform X2 [Zophobas morio]|uniref:gustatory receptor for sugar taste 64e-like isoform X2 n=1 Tax=Zophobas morio TaxID=2755281 RepID=UPI0030837BF6
MTATSLLGHLIWSFNDLFIVAISSALALRFKQITNRLCLDEKKSNSNNYWTEIRADYDRLVHLSRKLEKYFSHIVLLSYSANIFFLLIQLSNVIGHLNHEVQILYYTYSFSFLILRVVMVSLYGAWIIDESKGPANILHCVPSATYNLEIRRLLLQISFNDVGITGNRMFKVTRGLLLNVAGAIVTYELVIIQFNDTKVQ